MEVFLGMVVVIFGLTIGVEKSEIRSEEHTSELQSPS